jgi:hypothetical protein
MSEAELAAANELMRHPPDFNMSSTTRLGLYVVGRLAQRHGIDVHLRRSPYGGTTAIVLIPPALVVGGTDGIEARDRLARRVGTLTGEISVADQAQGHQSPIDTRDDAPRGEPTNLGAWFGPAAALPAQPDDAAPQPTLVHASHAEPATAGAETSAADSGDTVALTPAGLPWRVRQASLAAGLRATAPSESPTTQPTSDRRRTPEQTREMMASYQESSLRGRAAADRSPQTAINHEPPPAQHPTPEAPPADHPRPEAPPPWPASTGSHSPNHPVGNSTAIDERERTTHGATDDLHQ